MTRTTFLILALACAPTEVTPTDKNVAPDVYDVHEWGLIDQSLSDSSLRLSAPAQRVFRSGTIGLELGVVGYGKPVLYFHVESGKRIPVQASAAVNGEMRMVEHWPRTFASDTEVRWDAELLGEPCTEPRSYPTSLQPFCTRMPDGICETSELPEYETDDASCLLVDGTQWPLLLYRAAPVEESERPEERVELPLDVDTEPNGTVRIRNRSNHTSRFPMFRLTRRPTGSQITRLDWPTPGEAVTIARAQDEAPSDEGSREATREALSAQGLTDTEVDAFFRAWEQELWGTEEAAGGETGGASASLGLRGTGRGGGGVGGMPIGLGTLGRLGIPGAGYDPRSADVLIYWLPKEVIDELAPLQFDPEPRHVHRAMMVRVSLI